MKNQKPAIKKPWERERKITDLEGQQSKVDRSHGNDTDVNKIVARFSRTGVLPGNPEAAQYADVTNLQEDLTDLMERVKTATAELNAAKAEQAAREAEQKAQDAARLKAYDEAEKLKTNPPGGDQAD